MLFAYCLVCQLITKIVALYLRKNQKFGIDMTVGSIPRHLLRFSIPMLIGNLMQIGYSIINAI